MEKQFEFKKVGISDAYLITLKKMTDFRGEIVKTCSKDIFLQNGINFNPDEEIIIKSRKNVLRGLHFQKNEGQAKLLRVIGGKIFCVILDINIKSNTFGKWVGIELNNEQEEVFVPRDCALGTLALENSVLSCYCDGKYVTEDCSGILWNDPELMINWPLQNLESPPVLSKKDENLALFMEYKKYER